MRKALLRLFSHRVLALARWDLHLLRVRSANRLRRVGSRLRDELATRPRPRYLNLGSGPRGLADPRWLNVDAVADTNVDFLLDLARPLPFPDGAFDGIFCEHVLEHFTREDGLALLREARRVLAPGAALRVVVPDAELLLRRYLERPEELLAARGAPAGATAMDVVNDFFRQRYEHQFLYDWSTLERLLREAGFATVERAAFRASTRAPALLLDEPRYEWESLYVDALA